MKYNGFIKTSSTLFTYYTSKQLESVKSASIFKSVES